MMMMAMPTANVNISLAPHAAGSHSNKSVAHCLSHDDILCPLDFCSTLAEAIQLTTPSAQHGASWHIGGIQTVHLPFLAGLMLGADILLTDFISAP
mmetsp:Transcript_101093/g.184508  ORF Transcript_101093/g.184508 Transcript_101093/m.184508 type:complete len:96 (+) Transcript_101093:3-290(+)